VFVENQDILSGISIVPYSINMFEESKYDQAELYHAGLNDEQ
jgi:hypothetical protein